MVKGLNVVVLIPAFNEQETIAEAINSVPRKILGAESVKILVVDDGSTDATLEKAGKAKADRIVRLPSNRGLGVAFRKGIDEAIKMKADAVVNMDADLQFDANDIQKLLQPILKGEADMVTCTRFKDKSMQPQMPLVKKFGNKVFTSVVNFLTQQKFTDTQCGFRAYSREAMLRLNLFGKHTYTQEVFLSLVENDLRIVEVPCRVKGQRQGKSKVVGSIFGYSLKALLIIIRAIRDYKPLAFFGSIGTAILSLGTAIAGALFVRWLLTGLTSPFTSLISVSALLIIVGFMLIILALIADMQGRQKKLQEEILYRLKKQEIEKD